MKGKVTSNRKSQRLIDKKKKELKSLKPKKSVSSLRLKNLLRLQRKSWMENRKLKKSLKLPADTRRILDIGNDWGEFENMRKSHGGDKQTFFKHLLELYKSSQKDRSKTSLNKSLRKRSQISKRSTKIEPVESTIEVLNQEEMEVCNQEKDFQSISMKANPCASKADVDTGKAIICEIDLEVEPVKTEAEEGDGEDNFGGRRISSQPIDLYVEDKEDDEEELEDTVKDEKAVKYLGEWNGGMANVTIDEDDFWTSREPKKKYRPTKVAIRDNDIPTGHIVTFHVKTLRSIDEEKKIIYCEAEGGVDIISEKPSKRTKNRPQEGFLKNPSVVLLLDNIHAPKEVPIVSFKEDFLFTDKFQDNKAEPVSINLKASIEYHEPSATSRTIFCTGSACISNLHCGYCGVLLPNNFEIDLRLEPTCKCTNCDRTFSNDLNLRFHRKSYLKKMVCEVKECEFSCRSKDIMAKHSKMEHTIMICPTCGKSFDEYSKLRNHEYKHKSDHVIKTCKYCNQDFKKSEIYHHIERVHTKAGKVKCPYEECGLEVRETYLRTHIKKIHSEEATKICTVCGKKIKMSYFADHEKIHEREKIKCNYCDMTFINEESRARHEEYRHHYIDKEVEERVELPDDFQDSDIMIKCFVDGCNFVTQIPKDMRVHYVEEHGIVERKIMRFQCPHEGCSFLGRKKFHINVHYKRAHSNMEVYPCLVCGKRLASNASRVRHMRVHTGEKPFDCAVCKRSFNQKTPRNNHEKRIHNYHRPPARRTGIMGQEREELEEEPQVHYLTAVSAEVIINP